MLAIVCKSYKAASDLENYGEDGKVNWSCALHKVASTLGLKINRRFFVICLDEIRPYPGVLKDRDTEGKLSLPDPLLPSGNIPPGFMGYAVNLINLDIHHLHTRTSRGYGLRETLFYCLFGELQVYRTREDMKHAKSCIKYGAVSLDGGIMRGNGIIFLGDCEPEVKFPVLDSEAGQLTPRSIYVLKEIEDKKVELADLDEKILEEEESHKKALAKFKKKSEQLRKFLEDKKPLANLLEYKT